MATASTTDGSRYELRFRPLRTSDRAFVFPCDAAGRVGLDELSRDDLNRYLYARAVVGKLLRRPTVACRWPQAAHEQAGAAA